MTGTVRNANKQFLQDQQLGKLGENERAKNRGVFQESDKEKLNIEEWGNRGERVRRHKIFLGKKIPRYKFGA